MPLRQNRLLFLLTPSLVSGVLTIVATIAAVGGAIIAKSSLVHELQQGFLAARELSTPTVSQMTEALARNPITGNLPLFLIWAAVGAVVYLVAVYIYTGFYETVELEKSLDYVNTDKEKLVVNALTRLLVQVGSIALWVGYSLFFLKVLLPYLLATIYGIGSHTGLDQAVVVAETALVLLLALHIHVVLMRLSLLRLRIV